MHYLYILYSDSVDKFYVGETFDINIRLSKHQDQYYKGAFTKIASDWKVVLLMECSNKDAAVYLENFIKKMKSRKFIEKIINDTKILEDILARKP